MPAILSRVLSEEIGRQKKWGETIDHEVNEKYRTDRDGIIQEIKEFMENNDIKYRQDFFFDGYHSV